DDAVDVAHAGVDARQHPARHPRRAMARHLDAGAEQGDATAPVLRRLGDQPEPQPGIDRTADDQPIDRRRHGRRPTWAPANVSASATESASLPTGLPTP